MPTSDETNVVRVRYFAAARELAGCAEEALELGSSTLSGPELLRKLADRHPRLAAYLARMQLAVNDELIFGTDEVRVRSGDRVDVLPPVAGGAGRMAFAVVREDPLSLDECFRAVAHPGAGGVVLFVGIVRDHAAGSPVARLDYEAHEALAPKEMRRILLEILSEHPGADLAAAHRIGALAVGDLAVVVAASAPHREEAFAACRAAIDRIKATVPIWKKEWSPDGTALWINLDSGS